MKAFKILAISFLCLSIVSCKKQYASKKLESKIDSVSYALGMDVAINIKASLGKIDKDLFIQGYINAIDSAGLLLEPKDLNIINAYAQQKRMEAVNKRQQKSSASVEKEFAETKRMGEEFLAYNKKQKGVITTKSGLQYQILEEGNGAKPNATSTVKVHYTGKLINGTVFESSRKQQQPSLQRVNAVIKGWSEGLQLMKQGAKYRFFIPQELAYGSTYKSKLIQPFTALVFEIELIEIVNTK